MELLSHALITFRDEMENDHYRRTTYGGGHGIAAVVGGSGIVQQILCTAAMHAQNNIIV